jgi:hypothetical protein
MMGGRYSHARGIEKLQEMTQQHVAVWSVGVKRVVFALSTNE